MFWFITALIFGAYLGAMFLETRDWVAGAGLALAIYLVGATYERGGKMIEWSLIVITVMVLLLFGSWSVVLTLTAFILFAASVATVFLKVANLFPIPQEEEKEDATDETITVRR